MTLVNSLCLLVLCHIVCGQVFNIPLPFGGFGIKKDEKTGQVELTGNQDVNFFGWGGRRNIKLVGGNGTFNIAREETAYVNGSEYGGSNSFEFDKKKGIDVGTNVTLADNKAVGGIGKEVNFLEGLFGAFKNLAAKKDK